MEDFLTQDVKSRINKLFHSSKSNSVKKELQFNITTDYLHWLPGQMSFHRNCIRSFERNHC